MAINKVWQRFIVDEAGNTLAAASVEVTRESDGTKPTLYDGRDTATANTLQNPMPADGNGFARFYVENGRYQIKATAAAGTVTFRNVEHWHQDQGVAQGDAPAFAGLTVNGAATVTGAVSMPAGSTVGGVNVASEDFVTERVTRIDEWQDSVIDTLNTPPGSPSDGDRYIVGTASTGAWSANADDIAQWDAGGGVWSFTTAVQGMATLDENGGGTAYFRTYTGTAWVAIGTLIDHQNMRGLQGGGSTERYHMTAAQHGSMANIVSAGHAEAMDQGVAQADSPTFNAPSVTSITVTDTSKNAQGAKTISTSAPSGGADGDVHYQV